MSYTDKLLDEILSINPGEYSYNGKQGALVMQDYPSYKFKLFVGSDSYPILTNDLVGALKYQFENILSMIEEVRQEYEGTEEEWKIDDSIDDLLYVSVNNNYIELSEDDIHALLHRKIFRNATALEPVDVCGKNFGSGMYVA